MKRFTYPHIIYLLAVTFIANSYILSAKHPSVLFAAIPVFLIINIFAGTVHHKAANRRLRICFHGAVLLSLFEASVALSAVYHIILAVLYINTAPYVLLWSALVCFAYEFVLFWNGIICVYVTSVQLGIKQRVIGLICGMLPIVNLIVLTGIIKTVFREVGFEVGRERLNHSRADKRICAVKYPILMVHGVFFRDSEYLNYWGRIPAELIRNGAVIYYGNHQSAASVADSAAELTARIKQIVADSGCEKLNIIAHSKGGLDCVYALAHLDAAPYVASLTTINSPHRGCLFADYLLTKIPEAVKNKVASVYNASVRRLGDHNPDFLAALDDLTASACEKRALCDFSCDGVFCQSVGSCMPRASGGKFPLNFSYSLVKYFDGENDGLVSEASFKWGEKYTHVTPTGKRGVSHADMIDLNRENIDGFDVREFYIKLAADLKERGL